MPKDQRATAEDMLRHPWLTSPCLCEMDPSVAASFSGLSLSATIDQYDPDTEELDVEDLEGSNYLSDDLDTHDDIEEEGNDEEDEDTREDFDQSDLDLDNDTSTAITRDSSRQRDAESVE